MDAPMAMANDVFLAVWHV